MICCFKLIQDAVVAIKLDKILISSEQIYFWYLISFSFNEVYIGTRTIH